MTRSRLVGAIALLLLATTLAWRARVQPLVTDEIEFLQTGPALWRGEHPLACAGQASEELLHHPPAYHLLLGALAAARGGPLDPLTARLPGILSLFLTAWITYRLARWLAEGIPEDSGLVAVALLLSAPLALQGALLVDIDSTILTSGVLAFLWLAGRQADVPTAKGVTRLAMGVAFAALLWIKLPTPFLATAALAAAGFLTTRRRDLVLDAVIITATGVALFTLSWTVFCHSRGLDAWGPIAHLRGRGLDRVGLDPVTLGKRGLRLLLWLGPWLPAAALLRLPALWRGDGHRTASRRMLIAFALLLGLGYLLVGGEAFGFPHYHVPLAACLAVLASGGFSALRLRAAWLLGLGSLAYFLLIGDPLYPVYTFAESVASRDVARGVALWAALVAMALWLAPALGVPFARKMSGLTLQSVLLVLAVTSGAALSVHQFRASYSTHYMYGERGAAEAIRALAHRAHPQMLTLAPKDLAFPSLPCGSYVFGSRSLSSGLAQRLLVEDRLGLVVLRRGDLADVSAQRTLAVPEVRRLLATEFDLRRIGDFLFYEKRAAR